MHNEAQLEYTKTNEETQMQARVFVYSKGGYTVTLFDIESGETVPTMRRLVDLNAAIALANEWAAATTRSHPSESM